MDSSQRALQLEKVFFFKFELVFKFLKKTKNFQKNIAKGVNIDQSEMYYISMDLTRQALQTYLKLFSNFGIIFRNNLQFFKIIPALDLCKRGGGSIMCRTAHTRSCYMYLVYSHLCSNKMF